MENKLNHEVIDRYATQFSDQILEDFFKKSDTISGKEVLNLTDIQQVNLFVIFRLLREWRLETSRIQSPFFDYDSKEVKSALRDFMNVISRHIRMNQATLKPLLEAAVADTVLLVLSPYDFYCQVIQPEPGEPVKAKRLEDMLKYIVINQSLWKAYLQRIQQEERRSLSPEEALGLLNELFEQTEQAPEDIEKYVELFNRVKLLQLDAVYGTEDENVSTQGEQADSGEDVRTVNDQHAQEVPTLAEVHEDKPIVSIKTHLSINQKFMFINQLFEGNSSDFNKVIDFLDNCNSQVEAMEFINNNYLKKNNWKKDAPEVQAFIDVVAKKYA